MLDAECRLRTRSSPDEKAESSSNSPLIFHQRFTARVDQLATPAAEEQRRWLSP